MSPSAEPVIVTWGVGLPELLSWLGVNSTSAAAPSFAIHMSPLVSNVGNVGSLSPEPESVTAGVGLPDVVSCPGGVFLDGVRVGVVG